MTSLVMRGPAVFFNGGRPIHLPWLAPKPPAAIRAALAWYFEIHFEGR